MSFEDIIEDSFQFEDNGDERVSEDDEVVSLKLMPGPRPDVEIDEDYFKSLCSADVDPCWTYSELAAHFGCSIWRIKRLKKRLGLTHQQREPVLPNLDSIRERWVREDDGNALYRMRVGLAMDQLSSELGVGLKRLRSHMSQIQFEPKRPWPPDEIESKLKLILQSPWNNNVGVDFAMTELRRLHQIVPRKTDVQKALDKLKPRQKKHKKVYSKSSYCVPGPRSLYHCDAHEKLAKIWGKEIHFTSTL